MKPTKTLIAALYSAADRIETEPKFAWLDPDNCNCGILAQELLNVTPYDLSILRNESRQLGAWDNHYHRGFCPDTGIPLKPLFKLLHEHGIEKDDLQWIERIPNEQFGRCHDNYRHVVSKTFRSMAVDLEIRRSNGEKP